MKRIVKRNAKLRNVKEKRRRGDFSRVRPSVRRAPYKEKGEARTHEHANKYIVVNHHIVNIVLGVAHVWLGSIGRKLSRARERQACDACGGERGEHKKVLFFGWSEAKRQQ